VKIIAVGKKASAQLRRPYSDKIIENYDLSASRIMTLTTAKPIADQIIGLYDAGDVDVVSLIFSRFKSVVSQTPVVKQLVPAVVEAGAAVTDLGGAAYEYEPSEEGILEELLPRNLSVQILTALLENMAGFYASQMTAMDNATRNAGDMISRYTLEYNRSRQAQITKELIEIISGAEALNPPDTFERPREAMATAPKAPKAAAPKAAAKAAAPKAAVTKAAAATKARRQAAVKAAALQGSSPPRVTRAARLASTSRARPPAASSR
jgi:hypothetical protein